MAGLGYGGHPTPSPGKFAPLIGRAAVRHAAPGDAHRGPYPRGREVDRHPSSTERQRSPALGEIKPDSGQQTQSFAKAEAHKLVPEVEVFAFL